MSDELFGRDIELGIPTDPGIVVGGGTSSPTGTGGTTAPFFPGGNVGGGPGAGFGSLGGPQGIFDERNARIDYVVQTLGVERSSDLSSAGIPDPWSDQTTSASIAANAQYYTARRLQDDPGLQPHEIQNIYAQNYAYYRNKAQNITLNVSANLPSDPGVINVGFSGTLGGDVPVVDTSPWAPGQAPGQPNVPYFNPNLGLFGQAGAQGGALFEDILNVDVGLDRAGAFLGSLTDVLAVTGVIPTGGGTGRVTQTAGVPQQTGTNGQLAALRQQNELLTALLAQQAGGTSAGGLLPPVNRQTPTQTPGGIPVPFNPAPSNMPGGAPIGVPASYTPALGGIGLDIPFIDIVPQGTTGISPRQNCTMSLPSRVDVPTRDSRGNVRFTTFKNMGRPLLWSGDLAASKRVRKVAAKARRAKGR
jgi:hypothetical protein